MLEPDRKKLIILLALITVLGLALRFCRLSNQSLWIDEISSIETARVPLDRMVERSAQNNSLPPYFLLLRPLVGASNEQIEVRARLISAIAGAFSIPVFGAVLFWWRKDWRAASIGALLLAVNPLHLWYSQEARAYALMLFLGLCCLLSFEVARAIDKWRYWAAYVLFALIAVAVHKTGLVFPLACAMSDIALLVRKRLRVKNLTPQLVLLAVAVLLVIEPSQPPAKEYGRASSILEIVYTLMTFVGGYSFGPSLTDIQNLGPKAAVLQHFLQTAIMAGLLSVTGVLFSIRKQLLAHPREACLVILGIGIVVLGGLISSFPYNVRYALPALFGFLGFLATLAVADSYVWLSRAALIAVFAVNLWADGQWFFRPAYRKNDSRGVAEWLVQNRDRMKSWTVLPDYLGYSVTWYLYAHPEVAAVYLPPKQAQTTSFPPVPDVLIIGRRHHLIDPDGLVQSYRLAVGEARMINSFAGFELFIRIAPP